ncbi:hypothetical protein [Lentibacillus amyloliquefaciens]|uniref:Uncharacterized protein n=1 Tax=Lentibacillus amyloliquefaciens TaxID=1472767 RepID=A0A0U4EZ50_9BACI|nr:hypothetical protein [Lentibacillus amyloliquefaciens]ALX48567.1 hypothetical protein AOX59_08060 [Lentibacillus amyloliquefaciens]
MDENKPSLKEAIFNDRKYSITKRAGVIIFIILLPIIQLINDSFGFALVLTATITGIIYFISKLYFYNTTIIVKDIIFLIIFVALLFWGIYIFYTL